MNATPIDEVVKPVFKQYEENDGSALERLWRRTVSSRFTTKHSVTQATISAYGAYRSYGAAEGGDVGKGDEINQYGLRHGRAL